MGDLWVSARKLNVSTMFGESVKPLINFLLNLICQSKEWRWPDFGLKTLHWFHLTLCLFETGHRWRCIGNGHLVGTSSASPQPQCGPESLNVPPPPPTPIIKKPPQTPWPEVTVWTRDAQYVADFAIGEQDMHNLDTNTTSTWSEAPGAVLVLRQQQKGGGQMLTLAVKTGMIKWANLQTRFGARQQGQQGPLSGAYLSLASLSSYTDLVCLWCPRP